MSLNRRFANAGLQLRIRKTVRESLKMTELNYWNLNRQLQISEC
jgi:hypothetical protein